MVGFYVYIYIYENYNPHHGSELDISLLLYTPIFYIYINVFMYYITCCQLFFSHYHLSHDGSMYGVHMLKNDCFFLDGIHVAIYGSTMDPSWVLSMPSGKLT